MDSKVTISATFALFVGNVLLPPRCGFGRLFGPHSRNAKSKPTGQLGTYGKLGVPDASNLPGTRVRRFLR
jgi:hypothetical protein